MPTERKMDEIETMFKATSKPKVEISSINEIKDLGVLFDDTPQGEHALQMAMIISKHLHIPLRVFTSQDFYSEFEDFINSTKKRLSEIHQKADQLIAENEVAAEISALTSGRVEKIIELFNEELAEEDKLSTKMMNELVKANFHLFVFGVPLFKTDPELSNLGYYLNRILKNHQIHSNFMLVPTHPFQFTTNILGFVSYEQEPGSVVAMIRRAISMNFMDKIKIVGIIEDSLIEALSRSDETEEVVDVLEHRKKLITKFEESFEHIVIDEKLPQLPMTHEIMTGGLSIIVKEMIEEYQPAFVLIRSVARLEDNLDMSADKLIRHVLDCGVPVLLFWD